MGKRWAVEIHNRTRNSSTAPFFQLVTSATTQIAIYAIEFTDRTQSVSQQEVISGNFRSTVSDLPTNCQITLLDRRQPEDTRLENATSPIGTGLSMGSATVTGTSGDEFLFKPFNWLGEGFRWIAVPKTVIILDVSSFFTLQFLTNQTSSPLRKFDGTVWIEEDPKV